MKKNDEYVFMSQSQVREYLSILDDFIQLLKDVRILKLRQALLRAPSKKTETISTTEELLAQLVKVDV